MSCFYVYEVKLPPNLSKIDKQAFFSCILLDIKLPKSITTIWQYAFGFNDDEADCKKVCIPASDFDRIEALVIGSGYPESRIIRY